VVELACAEGLPAGRGMGVEKKKSKFSSDWLPDDLLIELVRISGVQIIIFIGYQYFLRNRRSLKWSRLSPSGEKESS
jgi:hypothetical protein